MENKHSPRFRIVEPSPWNRGESYNPEAIEQIRARLNGKPRHYRPSTVDRISDALDSPFAVGVYVGVYAGMLLTVALAFVWSWFL